MIKFVKYILVLFTATLLITIALDYSYTEIMSEAKPRTKFQYIRSLKNKKTDYIFLGSSRVENVIIPSLIKELTNKDALNFGFQASKMGDIYTMLKLIKKYNIQSKKILIQVDYIYNLDSNSNIMQYQLMPFVRENEVTKEYFDRYFVDDEALYYVPFYRYCQNDNKIGFREIVLNLAKKKTTVETEKGYVGLNGKHTIHNNSLPDTIAKSNPYLDKIKSFCKANKIDVVFYCAPFCSHSKNLNFVAKLKQKIPELKDYSNAVKDTEEFENCTHLNGKGAITFTTILAKDILSE